MFFSQHKKTLRRSFAILFVLFLVLFFLLSFLLLKKYHNPSGNSGIHFEFIGENQLNGIEKIISNIPENFQVSVITTLAPFYHGMFSRNEAKKMQTTLSPIYDDIHNSPAWNQLPSGLGEAYLSILHIPTNQTQYFAYIPEHQDAEKLPVIIFLHGFGGNFSPYLYQLSILADTYNVAILAPSYKYGNWDSDSVKFIEQVEKDAETKFDIDRNNVYLLGFSNGGLIETDVFLQDPNKYQGLIFLSTYLDEKKILDSKITALLTQKNLLIIQGSEDNRINTQNTKEIVQKMQSQRINVTLKEFPSDHFVFFEKNDQINEVIGQTFFSR